MKSGNEEQLKKRIRNWTIFFIVFLVLSGVTAFPIETELAWLSSHNSFLPSALERWIQTVYNAVRETNSKYPYLAYGTDWLAFAHIVIAVAFIGPLKDPVKNVWIFQFGMIACLMVFPLALVAGHFRFIPMYWRLIDCSFGVIGFVPLQICYRNARQLEKVQAVKRGSEQFVTVV